MMRISVVFIHYIVYPLNLVIPLQFWKFLVTCFITDLSLFFFSLLIHKVLSWTYQSLSGVLLYFLFFLTSGHFALLSGRFSQLYLLTSLLHYFYFCC